MTGASHIIAAILCSLALLACGGGGAPERASILVEGDSLASPPWAAWPQRLDADVTVTAEPGRPAWLSLEIYPDTIGRAKGGYLILIAGTNDLSSGRSGADTAAVVLEIWRRAQAQGLVVIGATVASTGFCDRPQCERERLAFNAALVATGVPLLRLDTMFPDRTDARFYAPDGVHYTTAADALIEQAVRRLIDR